MNIVGGAVCTVGYGAGKVGEKVAGKKAIDSVAFKAGFTSWMWTNGIFPSSKYEPLGVSEAAIKDLYGMETTPKANDTSLTPIIVSNHVSYLDGVVLGSLFGAPKIVAKAGARDVPVLGNLMEEMEVVFVQRDASDSRHATLDAIKNHCSAWKPGQRPLLIFAEGTTTSGECLAPFKRGAFIAGAPVRPVLLVYTGQGDVSIPNYKDTGNGVEKISDQEWAAQFMGHFVHSLHVRILAPYVPNEAEKADADLYTKNVEAYMASHLRRVREEVFNTSWQAAAGRTDGGMGYKFGDVARIAVRRTRGSLGSLANWSSGVAHNVTSRIRNPTSEGCLGRGKLQEDDAAASAGASSASLGAAASAGSNSASLPVGSSASQSNVSTK
jgi:1-acyl-sn-glycerol-3-phosphate acyltransferase